MNRFHLMSEDAARCRKDMIPFLQTETITVNRATGLAALGRGQVKFAAFVPNGMGWFLRYSNNCCIYGPEITDFPSTFQSIVQELETTHPRKDECIDFVAFGLHDLLLARFENGKSAMFVPEDEKIKEQISKTLLEEVEKRLEEGWTFGNRTTLCGIDSERWFIEWKRGSQAEYRYSMGIGQSEDLQRVSKVLSAPEGGSGGGGNTAELVSSSVKLTICD